ncbi:alpha-glucosidase [Reichenbachiella faecimaris]|uniref:Alpha-glucosidase n=1 Tax=Reichenbachiella faecimaris TaxID=692418 RepID=A0A1W2G8L0_REIFA|nr:glycoside hydrolase family 97 protein [Reichenbachiella faecimaris]SMD32772.1 alpha-glucosidase [Reichenbachiella faecimaris]
MNIIGIKTSGSTKLLLLVGLIIGFTACDNQEQAMNHQEIVRSPDGQLELLFSLENGVPHYALNLAEQKIVSPSRLGFEFQKMKPLADHLQIREIKRSSVDDEWETVWGERRVVRNAYTQLEVSLVEEEGDKRYFTLFFRVFDDGLGFRYAIPEQDAIDSVRIMNELTAFNFTADHSVWYQPCDTTVDSWENGYNSYERLYENKKLNSVSTLIHTPATFESTEGFYFSIHEANLTNYASMVLTQGNPNGLTAGLVPWPDGVKVKTKVPMVTPWRTIQVSNRLAGLVESDLILNLNEPNKLSDVSWIQPMKYIGIWWEMHLNKSTWEAGPNHGATTENTAKYIDFAADNGFGGVLVEGWNPGWDVWTTKPNFSFTESYPDFNLPWLAAYAQKKGVNIIGHHETSGDALAYEKQMSDAYGMLQDNGIHSVKTGYVGYVKPEGQNHHGQWMINHYRRVVELAAQNKVCIVAHEPIKPTGIRRTYPNMLSREAVRGMEYNAWSTGNPPEHTTVLPFTMLLAGPLDYTPGIFQTDLDAYRKGNSTHSTLANQLALYVTIYSPVQMAADLPEHYMNNPAFQFVQDVVTDWEDSKLLDGKIGDYVAIARKARGSEDWFVGAVTDENERELNINLDFLKAGEKYLAQIYADGDNAHYETNPMTVKIDSFLVDNTSNLNMKLAAGGGQAVRLKIASPQLANGKHVASF